MADCVSGHATLSHNLGTLRLVQVTRLHGRRPDLVLHGLSARSRGHDQVPKSHSRPTQHHLWRPTWDLLHPGEWVNESYDFTYGVFTTCSGFISFIYVLHIWYAWCWLQWRLNSFEDVGWICIIWDGAEMLKSTWQSWFRSFSIRTANKEYCSWNLS